MVAPESISYLGVDLLEFNGKDGVKYALKVADILFSEQELITSVLIQSNKTSRKALSPTRVSLLKTAVSTKFKYAPSKFEKVWQLIKDSINNKGRSLKAREERKTQQPSSV